MPNYWRQVGMTYITYSNICARVTREALVEGLRQQAASRNKSIVTFTYWKDGAPVKDDVDPKSNMDLH